MYYIITIIFIFMYFVFFIYILNIFGNITSAAPVFAGVHLQHRGDRQRRVSVHHFPPGTRQQTGSTRHHRCKETAKKPDATWPLSVPLVSRSVLVKRMFRPSDEDLCPSPQKQIKEETQKRGTRSLERRWVSIRSRVWNHWVLFIFSAAVRTERDGRGVRRADAQVPDAQRADGRGERRPSGPFNGPRLVCSDAPAHHTCSSS